MAKRTTKEPTNDSSGKKPRMPFGRKKNDAKYYKAVPLNEEGKPDEVSNVEKAKGVAQMAAGSAITAAGIPMLVLPGPGVAAIVGGAALTLKGHRTMTGRDPLPIEQSIDDAAERLATKAKEEAAVAGRKIAHKASDVREKIADEGPQVVMDAVKSAPGAVASAVKSAPEVASSIASQAPEVADVVGRAVSRGAQFAVGAGAEAVRQGKQVAQYYRAVKEKSKNDTNS